MSYSTYIGIQYWEKRTHWESVQPTYIHKDFIQAQDPTYIGPQYNKKIYIVGINISYILN
jgi:hypothetical protein